MDPERRSSPEEIVSSTLLRRPIGVALAGVAAGTFLFVTETIERAVTLRASLGGAGNTLRLALLFLPVVAVMTCLGFAVGALGVALEIARRLAARLFARVKLPERVRLAASFALAVLGCAVVFKLFSGRVLYRMELVIKDVIEAAAAVVPALAGKYKILYISLIVAAFGAILGAHLVSFAEGPKTAKGRAMGYGVASLTGLVVLVLYRYDGGESFGHNELAMHHPLLAGYALIAILGASVALGALTEQGYLEDPRRDIKLTYVLLGLFLASGAALGWASRGIASSRSVKALLMNRSIVARRVYEIARALSDRDGDGYSSAFGGFDPDDSNPRVSPAAPEIPGNGVDDNGIGGDLPRELAARAPSPGEFGPVPSPEPPWSPRYTRPEGVRDVADPRAGERKDPSPEGAAAGARPHVFLFSIDALRADHTTMGGYRRDTTPSLAKYAKTGVYFERCFAQGTNTGHSFVSLLRSSYMEAIFDRNVPLLTTLLGRAGYHTASVNARRLEGWLRRKRWHMYRGAMIEGFDVLHLDGADMWNAEELSDKIIAYLDKLPPDQPEFLWVHWNDVHNPRVSRPEYGFGDDMIGGYDNAVAYTDQHVGRVLDRLRDKGMLAKSVVFIMADHGEGFLEHGTIDHGNRPYQDNIHVPLVVLAPGASPAVVREPVALIDVAPTALAAAGLPIPSVYRGIDLIGALKGGGVPHRVIVAETPRNVPGSPFYGYAYIDWPYKALYDIKATSHELFDLEHDPSELTNVVDLDQTRARSMFDALGRWLDVESTRRPSNRPIH